MSIDVLFKLLGLFTVIVIGWGASRAGVFRSPDASKVLSNAAFLVFGPALLFRTTARMDFAAPPVQMLIAFFAPALLWMAVVRWVARRRRPAHPARPAVLAVTLGFGNSVQLGIPMAATVFGDAGLQLHLAIVSLHALLLLSLGTAWAELDVAHARAQAQGRRPTLGRTLLTTARHALIHPVVLPVLLGLGWNALALPLPVLLDDGLQLLGQGMVPLCLLLIGVALDEYGLRDGWRGALATSVLKLFVMPAFIGAVAVGLFGLSGLPLSVVVLAAALPVGSNPLLFAHRYGTMEARTTATIVLSTAAYVLAAPFWLWVLGQWAR
ncbi:hypothetical protein C7444_101371 [Sphaerotilus hippei]|uniref:Transporter n=1 Tax=Sphaerotilus hippei TaxID=744406 RepID=A0A318H709_9BURK|nr:AEC family transporter [Sphaerotilus hippei]PXW99541.1 hypothetical protein C7444_101371 [Sphaerotilus hippei]